MHHSAQMAQIGEVAHGYQDRSWPCLQAGRLDLRLQIEVELLEAMLLAVVLPAVDVLGNREHDKQDDGEGDAVDSRKLLRKEIHDGGDAQQQGRHSQTNRDL